MKRSTRNLFVLVLIIIGVIDAMAIEEAAYKVVEKDDKFEIRDYAPHIPSTIFYASLRNRPPGIASDLPRALIRDLQAALRRRVS